MKIQTPPSSGGHCAETRRNSGNRKQSTGREQDGCRTYIESKFETQSKQIIIVSCVRLFLYILLNQRNETIRQDSTRRFLNTDENRTCQRAELHLQKSVARHQFCSLPLRQSLLEGKGGPFYRRSVGGVLISLT